MPKKAIIPKGWRDAAAAARMSPAIRSGGHIFTTGITASGPDGTMPPNPEEQFRAVFDKLRQVLAADGAGLGDVVEMTSYHVGLRGHFDLFDAIRCEAFSAPWPAWTAVEVAGLRRPGALVELRVVAQVPDREVDH